MIKKKELVQFAKIIAQAAILLSKHNTATIADARCPGCDISNGCGYIYETGDCRFTVQLAGIADRLFSETRKKKGKK